MDITIQPKKLRGNVEAIPSKSVAHRLLICAAFADKPTKIICPTVNDDILATIGCIRSLGAQIETFSDGFTVFPAKTVPEQAQLDCRESGSTLRFMLPVAGALGVDTVFRMEGRLPRRPLSPLWEEMQRMGCTLSRPDKDTIRCTGKLKCGLYRIDGGVSSQYITGLLLAHSLMEGESRLEIFGNTESAPYIEITKSVLSLFGAYPEKQPLRSPGTVQVEGDWSNAAFFLAAGALGSDVSVSNLNFHSAQGDRAVAELLDSLKNHCTVDASDIPDLVPILAVTAAANRGAVFTNVQRLRLKESDRVESTVSMLQNLGIRAEAAHNTLTVYPGSFSGGTVDAMNDHRIAMAAAMAATVSAGAVTILGAQCVNKSYPSFWEEYKRSGGEYELYLR